MIDLGALGGLDSYATLVNNKGQVVGVSYVRGSGSYNATMWVPPPPPATDGYFEIVSRSSGHALDVFGASLDDVAPIIQWPVNRGDNQAWTLEPAGDGYVRIVARHSGKAMDVELASSDDGARVIQYTPHDGANQQCLFRAVPSTAGAVSTLSAR